MAGPFCSPVCGLLFSCTFCSPVSRFTFRLSCLLPGFFLLPGTTGKNIPFCLPLSPFACRLERVVDPGQQRVERKNAIPGSISVLLPGFILRFPKKSGNTSRFNREDFSNREHHTKTHILPRYRPWIPEKYREEFSKTGKIGR